MKIGDSVKVKKGVKDVESNSFDMENWQGRIIDIEKDENANEISLVLIAWDSQTLKQILDNYIIESEEDGSDWSEYFLYPDDVILTEERDTPADVDEIIGKLKNKFAYANLGEAGKRIMKIIKETDTDETEKIYERWKNYLEKNFIFPQKMKIAEFQENYKFSQGDVINVKNLNIIDDHYGIIISGKWKNESVDFPLCDLEVINKKSKNYQIVKDYAVWFANKW